MNTYDNNRNLTKDLNKNISNIQYNSLNLPQVVTFTDGSTITYTYSADGKKLRTVHVVNGTTTTTDYSGNVLYENGNQKLLLTEAGYVDLADNSHHFYIKDHLGNNRVVADTSGNVKESNQYYPFGLLFANSNSNLQPYKYNGKEYDSKNGLNWYDYGARHYDAALGRFMTQDRFAEKYYAMSSYQYGANNPVCNVDVNGDSIRVYIETKNFGHAWMSVGEGNNMVVYSYGRYNGTYKGEKGINFFNSAANGDGVLLRMEGESAVNYMKGKAEDGVSSYLITDIKDTEVGNILDDIFYASDRTPDNPKSKYYNNSMAHIIDSYKLVDNNCTTFVSDALNKAGSSVLNVNKIQSNGNWGNFTSYPMKERFIVPASLKRHLDNLSIKNSNVYKTK